MNQTPNLDRVHVASPCPVPWGDMEGDERRRFCGKCQEHVFNLSDMTTAEAEMLLAGYEKRPCVQYYVRKDGGVMTKDCPEGLAFARRRRLVALAATAGATALFGLAACQQTPRMLGGVPMPTGGK